MVRPNSLKSALVGALALVSTVSVLFGNAAHATLMIEVSDGLTTQTLVDNTGADIDAREGVLGVSTSIGDFSLVLTLAQSKPFVGSATDPVLDLTFAVTSFTTGGTLTIKFSENGFIADSFSRGNCRVGGVTSGTVGYECFYDNGNTELATTTQIASLGPFGPGAFSGSESISSNGTIAPFALTDVLTITHGSGLQLTTGNANAQIPEPGTLALFGLGLLGLGFLWRRRSRADA